jgi:hypothetical protein
MRLLNVEVLNHKRHLLALAHGHEEVVPWREVKGVAKNLNPFLGFSDSKDKELVRARMQESQNLETRKVCFLHLGS